MLKICLKLKKGCHRIIIFTLACLKMTLKMKLTIFMEIKIIIPKTLEI